MRLSHLALTLALLLSAPLSAQKLLSFDDRAAFLNDSAEANLATRLGNDSLSLTRMIDNRKRCDYWFARLSKTGNDLQLIITDCIDKTAGSKNLGSVIFSATDQEKALLLYYAITEIIRNPYKDVPVTIPGTPLQQETLPPIDPGQHRSRYFFAPSSYNLEKGELYYNTLYFFLHDVQYGISKDFSLGMGTSIIGFPFYLTPKVSFPVNEKSSIALGDMLMIGTYGSKFTGNLLYITYTRGNRTSHFTAGGGYLAFGGRETNNDFHAPVLNISALGRISDHIYFITENYISFSKQRKTAWNYDYSTGYSTEGSFDLNATFIYNLIGFRFINKSKDVRCWQIGLSFISMIYGEVPSPYNNHNAWSIDGATGSDVFPIPVIGYARKFSTRY